MYLVVEPVGASWRWTLYSAYHRPVRESPIPYPTREACRAAATEARSGSVDVPIVERAQRQAPAWPVAVDA